MISTQKPETMDTNYAEVKRKGRSFKVASTCINGRTVVATGKWLKIASVKDEDYLEGSIVEDPELFLSTLKTEKLGADIFTFAQKLPETTPKHKYRCEWDNVAAIPTQSFQTWWNERVSSNLRKDVRRAKNRGVVVNTARFDDDFVRGIKDIYDETPIRQGRPFWHYRKDLETIRADTATYLERSEFLGAYHEGELIGFLKIVYVDQLGCLMQIMSKIGHQDKRPTNALIAKAVEVCETRKCLYLTYGKYAYGRNKSSLTDFKHRNGFDQILLPRYYAPLTARGSLALRLGLHHGVKNLLPDTLVTSLVNARSRFFRKFVLPLKVRLGKVESQPSGTTGTSDEA